MTIAGKTNIIKISEDFSDAVGARDRKDGQYSGQEFYEDRLKAEFELIKNKNEILTINFDDSWGYPSSFISGVFGRLSRDFGKDVLNNLKIVSNDDLSLGDQIKIAVEEGYGGE